MKMISHVVMVIVYRVIGSVIMTMIVETKVTRDHAVSKAPPIQSRPE